MKRTWSIVMSGTVEADTEQEAEAAMLLLAPIDNFDTAKVTPLRGSVHDDGGEAAQKINGAAKFDTFAPGDRVQLRNLRPGYLVGAPATVIEKAQTRIRIRIDDAWLDLHPQAKSRWAGVITASPDMLEPMA